MAQYSVPSADLVVDSWLDEGDAGSLFAHIVPGTPGTQGGGDDSTYIKSPSAPSDEACGIDLSTIEDPISSAGHIMRWRAGKEAAGGATITLDVELREGYVDEGTQGDLIASKSPELGDSFAADSLTLSGGEADDIGDYGDLQLRLNADQS